MIQLYNLRLLKYLQALCASNCVQKSKFVDQKCMQAFIEHQQQSMQKFIEESSQKQAEQEATVVDSNISDTENKEIVKQESK